MKKWWEVFHKKGKTNQQDVFHGVFKGDWSILMSIIKSDNNGTPS